MFVGQNTEAKTIRVIHFQHFRMKDPEIPHCTDMVISVSEVLDISYSEDDRMDSRCHLILKG